MTIAEITSLLTAFTGLVLAMARLGRIIGTALAAFRKARRRRRRRA